MIHHRTFSLASGYDENIYSSYGTFIIAQQAHTHRSPAEWRCIAFVSAAEQMLFATMEGAPENMFNDARLRVRLCECERKCVKTKWYTGTEKNDYSRFSVMITAVGSARTSYVFYIGSLVAGLSFRGVGNNRSEM